MTDFDIWDIIKVPFPYTDRPVRQYRPALVVGRHAGQGAPALLWVLMITSASHRRWISDSEIQDLETAGLPAPSIVRIAKMATIEMVDAAPIGYLSASGRPEVRDWVGRLLGTALGTGNPGQIG